MWFDNLSLKNCPEGTKLVLRFEYQVSRLKPQAGKRIEQLKQHVG